jgi:hypothetical protein
LWRLENKTTDSIPPIANGFAPYRHPDFDEDTRRSEVAGDSRHQWTI